MHEVSKLMNRSTNVCALRRMAGMPLATVMVLWLMATLGAAAPVHAQAICPTPGSSTATLSGVVNSYWDGSNDAVLNAGDSTLVLGVARAGNPVASVAAGDVLLVIQVQDGEIASDNTANYGAGTGSGAGTTSAGQSGRHEFVVATSAGGAGSTISFTPQLANTYTQAAATSSRGQRRYQVVHVPRYANATAAGVTAPPWNGLTGGVVSLDVAQVLTLSGATVDGVANRAIFVAGRGFRGAAGVNGTANSPASEWRRADGTGATNIAHGGKGEGIAGTPRYLALNTAATFGGAVTTTTLSRVNTGVQGYPGGDRARGAPGNAGGGGGDGDSGDNQRNAGGGGGGNYAAGGLGGRPWDRPLTDTNGRGGAGYSSLLAFNRILMGGGGGSGGTNNATDDANTYENKAAACGTTTNGNTSSGTAYGDGICSSGASGGGIVILRARSITGTGVIDARGAHAYNVRNDAGGGGGAGGSVVLHTVDGGSATVDVSGGDGGNAWAGRTTGAPSAADRHGPGGGGGGGFVAFTPSGMAVNALLDGGSPGRTTNGPTDTYGSFGNNGGLTSFESSPSTPGILPGAQCLPDLRLQKSNGLDIQLVSGITTYTLEVSNIASVATAGPIAVVDVLPVQLSVADGPVVLGGPQAADWSCSAAAGTLTCGSAVSIPASGVSRFSFVATVSAANGDAIINRARVGGGGDPLKPAPTPADVMACTGQNTPSGCAVDADVVNAPFLALEKSSSTLVSGNPGSYVLTVRNNGSQATSGSIRIVDVLPAGVTFSSAASSPAGFTCAAAGQVVTCNSSASIGIGASVAITLNVNVAAGVASSITNRARVGGGGDPTKPTLPPTDGSTASQCPAPTAPAAQYSDALTGCASVTEPVSRVLLLIA